MPEARGRSIPRARRRADSLLADLGALAHGLALVHDRDSARALVLADLVPVDLAALHLRRRQAVRNALHRAAAAVASSSIRRPKKAR
jgi:hypothetical protein